MFLLCQFKAKKTRKYIPKLFVLQDTALNIHKSLLISAKILQNFLIVSSNKVHFASSEYKNQKTLPKVLDWRTHLRGEIAII